MSKSLDYADLMAAKISSIPELQNPATVVHRQKNITSEVDLILGKSNGCIVIVFTGFTNPDKRYTGENSTIRRSYSLMVYSLPVVRKPTDLMADDLLEGIAKALQNWEPPSTTRIAEIIVTSCAFVADETYLIYELTLEVLSPL